MTTFYLIRHGEAQYGFAEERQLAVGLRDMIPLTDEGREQLARLADELRPLAAELVICSPMTRAVQSAAILSRSLDIPLRVEFYLHETLTDLGMGCSNAPNVWAIMGEMSDLGFEWPPGETRNWEPSSSVRERVIRVLERYLDCERVLVVSHGGVLRTMTGEGVGLAEYRVYALGASPGEAKSAGEL